MKINTPNIINRFNDGRDWFLEKRFGMFIHWGIYALTEWHEQALWRLEMDEAEYENMMHDFNPTKFNPNIWIDAAQNAGMEFLCFTAKHHDGFCMWDTKYTDYKITNTPYKKDVLKMLSDACAKRGMGFGIYYSLPDWHHPNYPNIGRHHELHWPKALKEINEEKYLEYVKNQVRELCENYGDINQFFWDINVAEFYRPELNEMIRKLQPGAIINDRGPSPGDYTTPERQIPSGGSFKTPVMAVNSVGKESWGYRKDEDYYTSKFLMQSIGKILSMNGNYMLNVGPMPNGKIDDKSLDILDKVGCWYKKVQEAFIDTYPVNYLFDSDLIKCDGIFFTAKDNSIYINITNDLPTSGLCLHPFTKKPKKAVLLNNKQDIETAVDLIPTQFRNKPSLRLKNIPVDKFHNEPMVIKMTQFQKSCKPLKWCKI